METIVSILEFMKTPHAFYFFAAIVAGLVIIVMEIVTLRQRRFRIYQILLRGARARRNELQIHG